MASTDDAAAGWEIYRNSGFSLTRDEVNDRLVRAGFAPVSPRTYDHYRRLQRRGFRRYVTINRLDTMTVPDPFKDESIRSRYAFERADVPTQLVLMLGSQQVEVLGTADALSDFGTEVVVRDADQMSALRQMVPPPGTPVTVNFLRPATTVYGTVDFVSAIEPSEVRIGIVFRRLTPVYELTGGEALPTSDYRFLIGQDGASQPLDRVSQDVYWLLQAVEASRGVINVLLRAITDDVVSPPPSVERLVIASPMDAVLRVSIEVYLLLDRAREALDSWGGVAGDVVRTWRRRPLVKAEAHETLSRSALIDAQAENIRAQTEGVRIDNERKKALADLTGSVAAYLIDEMEAAGRSVDRAPRVNIERLATMVFGELQPSLQELNGRGLEVGPAEESPAAPPEPPPSEDR